MKTKTNGSLGTTALGNATVERHAATQGPWRTSPRGPSELQHVTAPCGKSVAQVWDYPEAESNARLIAAAPELLDALKMNRAACAAFARVVARCRVPDDDLESVLGEEFAVGGVPYGFGAKANELIRRIDEAQTAHQPEAVQPSKHGDPS